MTSDQQPAPEIRIRQRATPAEIAAVTAAVAAVRTTRPARPPSPWLRAALLEGLGGRPATQPFDLRDAGPAKRPKRAR